MKFFKSKKNSVIVIIGVFMMSLTACTDSVTCEQFNSLSSAEKDQAILFNPNIEEECRNVSGSGIVITG